MHELASPHNEASINRPTETNITPMQQQAVEAWREIGNLPKNQPPRSGQNEGFITFDVIFGDSDSVTHCSGFSSPDLSAVKCVTQDLVEKPERNENDFPDKKDKSLRNKNDESAPLIPLKEKISEKPSLPTPEKSNDDFPTNRPLTAPEKFRRNRIVDPLHMQLESP